VVSGLAAQAAEFMGRAGYSPGSRADYQRIWGQFGEQGPGKVIGGVL